MTRSSRLQNSFFARAFTAVALLGPILLVIVAGTMPEGSRGELTVYGNTAIVGLLAASLLLRAAYGLGYSRARRLLESSLFAGDMSTAGR